MPRYTAHMPPQYDLALANFEHVRLIKDRFSIIAAFLTPFWLGFNLMWLELLSFFGVAVGLGFVTFFLGVETANGLGLLIAFLIGFEAAELQRRFLTRYSFKFIASLYANDTQEAFEKLYDLMADSEDRAGKEA